ncbi:MAG: phosphoribosylformylglycinamidine synthase subunit PurQ [Bacteroidetes bacterium]|nr:phosphoribosylformylglycinamidine synthase subunit PurQ [Bacteroidota bacterium]
MAVKFGVIVFPGSNCDHDAFHAIKHVLGEEARFIWHKEESIGDSDVIIVPGGFSYGDYLRSGAIARFSPVMRDVVKFAADGGLVMGICNGFQILCEAGLLPGALMRNTSLRFVCDDVNLRVETTSTPFTHGLDEGSLLRVSVAHGEGNYYASDQELDALEANDQIVFRYVDESGVSTASSNPNGSARNIAGIVNTNRNVLGMMPHPERHVEGLLGSADGLSIFESVVRSFAELSV